MKLRNVKEGETMKESYSDIWSDNAWDAYDIAMEYLGAEGLCEALAKAMGTDALADNLKYIFRVNEIPFDEDEEELSESFNNDDKYEEAQNYIDNGMTTWREIFQDCLEISRTDKELYQSMIDQYGSITEYAKAIYSAVQDILENDTVLDETFSKDDDLEDLIQEFEQEYDSSVTSINSSKLPTIFGLVQKLGGFKKGTMNLDYGGGRFDNVAQYLKDYDVLNLVYDPFNRSKEHNKDVLDFVKKNGGADTITCSNVLNVIKEPENRLSVIKNCDRLVKSGGTVYFTVYEGSGSGEGKANDKRKSYQTNMKTEDYQEELEQVFGSVTRKGKLFICK